MKRVIVSMTSYPKRISYIEKVLDSMLRQTILPDIIVIYLSREEFENTKDIHFVKNMELMLKNRGVVVRWVNENYKSHKKYFYAFSEYPNDVIITIDDDIIYKSDLIENLLHFHRIYGDCVIAGRVHLITATESGEIAPYTKWWKECKKFVGIPRMDLFATGCGGVLYPPECIQKFNISESLVKYMIDADDVLLKLNEVKCGIRIVLGDSDFSSNDISMGLNYGLYNTVNVDNHNSDLLMDGWEKLKSKEKIETHIFVNGKTKVSDMEKEIKDFAISTIKKIVCQANKNMYMYGAGHMARKIISILESEGKKEILKSIVVSNEAENDKELCGIPVIGIDSVEIEEGSILISLRNTEEQKKIISALLNAGFGRNQIVCLDDEIFGGLELVNDWRGSADYWEQRYREGGTSGAGSYNNLWEFKAEIINDFVKNHKISKVIEFGCGDGNQLRLAEYPSYIGYDVSKTAIDICKKIFCNDPTKSFLLLDDNFVVEEQAELVLSLDVIYHLVEDDVYEQYMERLVKSSSKYICIYSSNFDEIKSQHVKCRKFTSFFENKKEWKLIRVVRNRYPHSEKDEEHTSFSDFYFYQCSEEH